jgi:hypothetical protein
MLVTVTNASPNQINYLDYYVGAPGGVGVTNATGGNVVSPLPYPFDWIGPLNSLATYQLPMHNRDWHYKRSPCDPQDAGQQWQQLIQAGIVTLAFAAETGNTDTEELFIHAL